MSDGGGFPSASVTTVRGLIRLPPELLERLEPDDADALRRLVRLVGRELHGLYRATARDHLESRGDNAQLFGMKIWTHGWFRYISLFADDPLIWIHEHKGSYALRVGPLKVGVYALGSTADEDIHVCVPDGSPTKRSYADHNSHQLALFEADRAATRAAAASAAATLNELTIGHFGNPRDGLTKWYVGALVTDESDEQRWAWVERQDIEESDEGGGGGITFGPRPDPRPPVTPFSEREVEDIPIEPRPLRPVREDGTDETE